MRPGRAAAQNCYPGGPKICTNSKGARVCVPDNLQCCSNDNCAIACPYPWRDCEAPGNCADTARMCRDPSAPDYATGRTKFCSQRVAVTNGCVAGGTSHVGARLVLRGKRRVRHRVRIMRVPGGPQVQSLQPENDQECVRIGLIAGKTCLDKCPGRISTTTAMTACVTREGPAVSGAARRGPRVRGAAASSRKEPTSPRARGTPSATSATWRISRLERTAAARGPSSGPRRARTRWAPPCSRSRP